MYFHKFFKLSLVLTIVGTSAPSFAQSTGQYTKIENRDCLVWNVNPVPNETVYWTGKCVNGMAEGKGIIAYGNIKNGKPTVSLSDVTVEYGKLTGLSEYYSRTGQISKRSYEKGKRTSSEPYKIAVETPSPKEDIFASRFRHGLVREVGISDLKALAEYGKFEIIRARITNNKPTVLIKTDNDLKFYLYGGACRFSNGSGCRGLHIGGLFKSSEPLTYSQVNKINKQYSLIKMIRDAQDPSKFVLSIYVILDAGQKPENLRLTMVNFETIVSKIKTKFKATQN